MPEILKLPEIAESVVEGEIVRWLKKEGEFVKKNEPVVEVETQKVTVEIPSPYEGILYKVLEPEGSVVEVGKPIAVFIKEGEKPPEEFETGERKVEEAEEKGVEIKKERIEEVKREVSLPLKPPEIKGKIRATPSARKLARELGIDLKSISFEGKRIHKRDVLKIKEELERKREAVPEVEEVSVREIGEVIPIRGIRREIAIKLRESKDRAVHTLHVDEADMTELVKLREKMKPLAEKEGVKLTFMPFIIKACIQALKKHPYVNATIDDEKREIILHKNYNIGVAVATEHGLIVPVVKNAERKTLLEIAREISVLAEKARKRELSLEDVEGGTFSITNIGSIGGLFSFPVINYPQVAILGFHSIKKRPIVKDGEIIIRDMVYLSLSFDHRVIDGAQAALFMNDLIKYLETPELIFLESI